MVSRLTRRIYIYGLDGLVGMPENFLVCRSQYAQNKAIARSIQKIATPSLRRSSNPSAHPFKNQIGLIKFPVATEPLWG
jgi:hypothetical protein